MCDACKVVGTTYRQLFIYANLCRDCMHRFADWWPERVIRLKEEFVETVMEEFLIEGDM